MSARLLTTPWLTKSWAGGALDTSGSCGWAGLDDGRWTRGARADRSARRPTRKAQNATGAHTGGAGTRGYHRVMLLVVDIGNTNITIGLLRGGALVATRRAATAAGAERDVRE